MRVGPLCAWIDLGDGACIAEFGLAKGFDPVLIQEQWHDCDER